VPGNAVLGDIGKKQPGDPRCNERGCQRWRDQWERQRAQQNFEREQRAAERHVVDGRHAGSGTARHQQPPFQSGKACPIGEQIGDRRAGLFGRGFASERSAHADNDDRENGPSERASKRQPPAAEPDRFRQFAGVTAGLLFPQPAYGADQNSGEDEHRDALLPADLLDSGEKGAGAVGPRQMLHGAQQRHEQTTADARANAGHDNEQPKPRRETERSAGREHVRLRRCGRQAASGAAEELSLGIL
jgi:hypothetical protein